MIRIDATHPMYLRDPERRAVKKGPPTPGRERAAARDRLDRTGPLPPDPNGSRAQREAYVRSRQLQPRSHIANKFDPYVDIGQYAIARMYAQLKDRTDLSDQEKVLLKICRKAVQGYKYGL